MKTIPPDSVDLIRALDAAYPPRCIGPNQTEAEAHRYAGKRELVDSLLHLLRQAEKRQLKDSL